jgi:glycosyltransferase involved in cell wall biosynthesis
VKVFIAIASARLAYGGPAVSVASLAKGLARVGVKTGLWCPDGSAGQVLKTQDEAKLRLLTGSLDLALDQFGKPDLIHDNGLWWSHNHRIAQVSARRCVPRVVSVRGMLEPWARAHKRWRKDLAWRLYQARDLRSAKVVHVTSVQEMDNLRSALPASRIACIGNGLDLPSEGALAFSGEHAASGKRQALFLGRLHPIKGLPLLLQAWHKAAPRGWRLVLAGPDEAGHRQQLEQQVAQLGLGACVSFTGPVSGEAKARLFAQSQLFILPSHSESFGMAVGEALAHGLPVITTSNVPWPQLERLDCGWRGEGTADALADLIGKATACQENTLAEMGLRGRKLIAEEFGWDRVAAQFIDLYTAILSQTEKPILS